MIYRGLFFYALENTYTNCNANVMFFVWLCNTSSIIFGLIHLNFLQFFFASFMGVVCCYIYEATGKIRYSMLLHLLNNSVLVLFSILPVTKEVSAIIQIALGVVSLVAAIVYLVYRKKNHSALKTDITKETKENCLYFFTSVPMIVFVLACLGVCAYMSQSHFFTIQTSTK